MLLNRDEISADKSFNLLTESILERDQAKTTDTFFKMVQSGQSIGDALSIVAAAEAPFVNVPCHINIRDGNITCKIQMRPAIERCFAHFQGPFER